MRNERLYSALITKHWKHADFADALGVDQKTVERWISKGRTPHRRTAIEAAALLKENPAYLWPNLGSRPDQDGNRGEVVTVYTERSAVPKSLWLSLLDQAKESVDILVYAGLHLPEANPNWVRELRRKCEDSVSMRIAFGDPNSEQVKIRGDEEGVGAGMAARIRYALAWYQPLFGCENLEIGFHSTVLYNSILRFDDEMLVNPHVLGMPAFRAPVLHLRRIPGGPLFETYAECFENVWKTCRPYEEGE